MGHRNVFECNKIMVCAFAVRLQRNQGLRISCSVASISGFLSTRPLYDILYGKHISDLTAKKSKRITKTCAFPAPFNLCFKYVEHAQLNLNYYEIKLVCQSFIKDSNFIVWPIYIMPIQLCRQSCLFLMGKLYFLLSM